MTATTIRVQMAQRKDTAANWTAANPILLSGELAYETDTEKFKIGDGTTNWNGLAYLPIPDGSGNLTITGNLEIGTTGSLTFEGSTADGFETTLAVTDPTADRTITLPDVSGTVVTTGDTGSITSAMLADGTIVDADVSATAEIAVSKLANGTANQVIVTDGTNVSWSDDLTLAGNLTVNGTTTTVNTQTLVVEDKNIELGVVATPTDLTADGGGITLKGTTDKTINWVDATDSWTSSEHIELASSKSYRINGAEVLSSTTLGSGVTGSSLTSVGTISSGTWQGTAIDAAYLDSTVVTTGDTGTVTSTMLADGTIVDGDINASAAIVGTKISPDFGSQNVTTTGNSTAASFIPSGSTVPTNGVYLPSANNVAISVDSSERIRIGANGEIGIAGANYGTSGQVLTSAGSGAAPSWQTPAAGSTDKIEEGNTSAEVIDTGSDGRFVVTTEGTEALKVDSSGRLLVGTTSAPAGTDAQYTRFAIRGNTLNTSAAYLSIGNNKTTASTSNGDNLGIITFNDNDSDAGEYARIIGSCDGTPGTNDYPGRLVFSTTKDGQSSPTEAVRIDADQLFYSAPSYNSTTATAANLVVEATGKFRRSTSSGKYKTDIETLQDSYADALLGCRPVWYRSTCAGDNPNWGWWGFIAEEVAKIDPRLVQWKTIEVTYDEKGSAVHTPCEPEPEGVAYDRFVPHLLNLIKRQKEQIEALEARLTAAGI